MVLAQAVDDVLEGLDLENLCVDGCIVKAPCGGEIAGKSPVDRGKQGTKRSVLTDGNGIPLGVVAAPANRNDSPLLRPTLEKLSGSVFICQTKSPCTWMLVMIPLKPETCSRSWPAIGTSAPRVNRYKPGPGGWWNAPTHGTLAASKSC